jgi:hypothetical protein
MSSAMTTQRFRDLLRELVEENPFAIRAVLKILDVVFTTAVPTLAVSCEQRPRLLVNIDFVRQHCRNDDHVKAVICHEFLHVLLRHTEQRCAITPARHIATDAVINAIIHRELGARSSGMMSAYYAEAGDLRKLLRPMNPAELDAYAVADNKHPGWVHAWAKLYEGRLVADDIEELAGELDRPGRRGRSGQEPFSLDTRRTAEVIGDLLGNHDDFGTPLPEALRQALDECLRQMNGAGIWRSPGERGIGAHPCEALYAAADSPLHRWEQKTLALLRRHATPDRRSRVRHHDNREFRIPVLSPRDRRAFLRATWSPFLPEATWSGRVPKIGGTTQVYLDVSGSMSAEMPLVVALLARLGRHVRRPFWAFSNIVVPAVIERGLLKTDTTGGTSMACVIEHLARTKPEAAIVVTDGYIERLDPSLLCKASGTRLHVLVTRDGNPAELLRAGLPYTQLDKVPT